ncbi:MAG: ribose-phosphate pyrophosphokinase [Eubacteriales bacterium]|nr:ribose-phosphate pyrophosphokinase [Eubacteriales bacterium]
MDPVGPIGLIALNGTRELTARVNDKLKERRQAYHPYLNQNSSSQEKTGFIRDDYRISTSLIRFDTGEGKAYISDTVRGHDIFILVDVLNYSCTYSYYGKDKPMSPDEHLQDLKRVIAACSGKSRRINVIMPYLYEGRQHKRSGRESLDCAYMLEELVRLGVDNIITFDTHDPRVFNAVPLTPFESIPSTYQIIKCLFKRVDDLKLNQNKLMIVSPDEGGINRAMYYSSLLNAPLSTFYKRRDYRRVVNGRNPIIAHEYLGSDCNNADILIIDDMISSGDSMLDIAKELKKRNAGRVYCCSGFTLFTDGLDRFDQAYADGYIDGVIGTNLIYLNPELVERPWFACADFSKFLALLVDAINHDASLSPLVDPTEKIKKRIAEYIERHQ